MPQIPRHVAIIMDGNGRWATKRGLPRVRGHRAGVTRIRSILQYLGEHGVEYVTIYAFSTENWTRPRQEVMGILSILRQIIRTETHALHERQVKILHIGRLDRLSHDLRESVKYAQQLTRSNSGMTLAVAFDYGGRQEILAAVKGLMEAGIQPRDLDEELFNSYLYTADLPYPDLIIRSGGEQRLSNFLLWQSAYSEFFSTTTAWPDLGPKDIDAALLAYSQRKRRFGAMKPEVQD